MEAVEGVEFDGGDVGVVDEFGEHAAGINRVELAVITDPHRSPLLCSCDLRIVVHRYPRPIAFKGSSSLLGPRRWRHRSRSHLVARAR